MKISKASEDENKPRLNIIIIDILIQFFILSFLLYGTGYIVRIGDKRQIRVYVDVVRRTICGINNVCHLIIAEHHISGVLPICGDRIR